MSSGTESELVKKKNGQKKDALGEEVYEGKCLKHENLGKGF